MNVEIGHEYIDDISGNSMNQFGVLGMKWGVQHRRHKIANAKYRTDKQKLNKSSMDKNQYKSKVKHLKNVRNKNRKDRSRDIDIINELYPLKSKELNRKVVKDNVPKTVAKAVLIGNHGALTYDKARMEGRGRIASALEGRRDSMHDYVLNGAPHVSEYASNLDKRLQNRKKSRNDGTNDPYLVPNKRKRK